MHRYEDYRPASHGFGTHALRALLDALGRIAAAINSAVERGRRARLRYQTEQALAELPPELRKDIGWPSRRDELY